MQKLSYAFALSIALAACGGQNVWVDQELAAVQEAAINGDQDAMEELERRVRSTLAEMEDAAEAGDPKAEFDRAFGSGDMARVETLADAGNSYAQTHMAGSIAGQSPSDEDKSRARAYLEAAAAQDNPTAIFLMSEDYLSSSNLYPADEAKALELGERAASLGHAEAMFKTGVRYQYGLATAAQDKTKAREWFNQALAAGYRDAQRQLDELGD
ncbi:MAG: hypothetical protein R3C52_10605 [Hyphomonadaceae bacterium]